MSDVSAGKLIDIFSFPVSITVLFFPITYIFADILTEVYGYSVARNVLWIVMWCSIIAGLIYLSVAIFPPSHLFDANDAFVRVLGQVPRIIIGGWIAVFFGDVANNYVMAKLKILTKGKYLWTRTISSTIAGQFVNTTIFYIIGLYGILPSNVLLVAIVSGWIVKVIIEVVFTPITYLVVGKLKRAENEDYYDYKTNFNPFIIQTPF